MVFSAAHFITFNGDDCERLHGHNYHVEVHVFGDLDDNQYVVDFIALRDSLQQLVTELDHFMLLPTEHPMIHVKANEVEVDVTFEDRRWLFPRGDCVLLPVSNTTAELLASYIGRRLLDDLERKTGKRPGRMRVAIDENGGQWGVCELFDE
ncbi:MAG: 6-pyruvoyl tetrahydropterin synthase family protein [Planctomycetes bacterium]|nr:6-pyruvoyl tetrahydropterin synthase family protein [Planctomycetota bacterium]